MKKLNKFIILAALLAFGSAQAAIIESLHLDFASGGDFDGTVTFSDDYSYVIDTAGYLSGGTNSYNTAIDWIWWGFATDAGSNGTNDDFLMSTSGSTWIAIEWDVASSLFNNSLSFVNGNYYNGVNYSDDIVDFFVSSNVPEPSILALMGLGIFGMGFSRRRRALKE